MSRLISAGMPVYNGEGHVGQAIAALRAQDYPNLEIIISDNASTDGTEEICRTAAAEDPRIKYHRLTTNIGMLANFRRVLELARGEYFYWAGHHDLWEPRFTSACAAALEANPNAVLAYPESQLIDEHGGFVEEYNPAVDTTAFAASERLERMLRSYPVCAVYGILRTETLRALSTEHGVGMHRPLCHVSPDVILQLKLASMGGYAVVPETLHYLRVMPQPSWRPETKLEQLSPTRGAAARWSRIQFLWDASYVIWKADQMDLAERLRIMSVMLRTVGWLRARSYLYEMDTVRTVVGRTKGLWRSLRRGGGG